MTPQEQIDHEIELRDAIINAALKWHLWDESNDPKGDELSKIEEELNKACVEFFNWITR